MLFVECVLNPKHEIPVCGGQAKFETISNVLNPKHQDFLFRTFEHLDFEFACPVKYVLSYFLVGAVRMVPKSINHQVGAKII